MAPRQFEWKINKLNQFNKRMKIRSSFFLLVIMFAGIQMTIAQPIAVSGTVKDVKGIPVPAASIRVKNTNEGTRTDSLGNFNIKVRPNTDLIISAIGFTDTTLSVKDQTTISAVLSPKAKSLNEVVISGASQNSELPAPDQIAKDQIISNALSDYVKGADINYSITQSSGIFNPPAGATVSKGADGRIIAWHIATTEVLNTVNTGSLIPVFSHQEDTRGSRYLFDKSVKGMVVNQFDTIINNPAYLYNYDKIGGNLLLTQDNQNYIEVDKQQIKSFALKGDNAGYVFEHVRSVKDNNFFEVVLKGTKYAVYKLIKTKLIKANHQTNGYTESGNYYDEYKDERIYYFVDVKNNTARQFELKKKSIKEVFGVEKVKTDKYFSDHINEDINEDFIKNLTVYLNQ
jgi:CarboxypepD_reg-like domain